MNAMIENLRLAAEVRKAAYAEARKAVADEFAAIINGVCAESGVAGYALSEKGYGIDFEYLSVANDNGGHSIDLYFHESRWDKKDEPRKLEINVCSMGSFGSDNANAVAYYTLVGFLANRLGEMTEKLNAISGWAKFYETRSALWDVNSEIDLLEREEKAKAEAEKEAKLEARLVVGAEIVDGIQTEYVSGQGYKRVGFATRKVEKMTAKLVWFERDFKQYKKADVIKNLARGFTGVYRDTGWSFLADLDFADFAEVK